MTDARVRRYALVPDGIWDGTSDSRLTGTAVVVNGALIESVTPVEELQTDLRRVELPGCTLIPGLMDAHVHYSAPMGPAFLAAGVTTVRDVGNDLQWILGQRAANSDRPDRGPAILCCGHMQATPDKYWPRMGRAHADADAVRRSVREHIESGVDAIKLYAGLDAEMTAAGIDEAHRLGKPATAHLGKTAVEDAVAAGLDGIEHLAGCHVAWREATEEEDDNLIDLLLEHQVVIDPTLVVWDRDRIDLAFRHDERRHWAHPAHRRYWESAVRRPGPPAERLRRQRELTYLKRFLLRAHGRGVAVALGADTPFPRLTPGFSVHDELGMYVDAGLSPVDALRLATSVNAKVLGVESRAGRVAPGLAADLVALKGNPLRDIGDIGNVELVARSGQVLDLTGLRRAAEASFAETPDDAITNDLLDLIEPDED